jgi:hypothetical protein
MRPHRPPRMEALSSTTGFCVFIGNREATGRATSTA